MNRPTPVTRQRHWEVRLKSLAEMKTDNIGLWEDIDKQIQVKVERED